MTPYYIDLGLQDVRAGMYDAFVFDEDGIPRYPYPAGLFYNVTFICHFALHHHMLFLKFKRQEDLDRFWGVTNWLLKAGHETRAGFVFPFLFSLNGLPTPWISALTQGRVLSVLARAYELSNDKQHLVIAQKVMTPFKVPVKEGGVQASFPNGDIAFEEYPFSKPNIVLNGLITALVGLHDLAEIGRDCDAADLFGRGVQGLERNLQRYDLGFWTTYDLAQPFRTVASEKYHRYHIAQLWGLYEMTGSETFKGYGLKWQGYLKGLRPLAIRTLSRSYKLAKPMIAKTKAALTGRG